MGRVAPAFVCIEWEFLIPTCYTH